MSKGVKTKSFIQITKKQFVNNRDYKIIAHEPSGAKKGIRGGHNKEIIVKN
jgi:hypothetical protein